MSQNTISDEDGIGTFSGTEWQWGMDGDEVFATSYRVYDSGDVVAFSQEFTNAQVLGIIEFPKNKNKMHFYFF